MDARSQIKHLEESKIRGLAIRSHIFEKLNDEKCTKYFYFRIKEGRESNNSGSGLRRWNGGCRKEVLPVYERFYRKLYSKAEVGL